MYYNATQLEILLFSGEFKLFNLTSLQVEKEGKIKPRPQLYNFKTAAAVN